MKPGDGQVGAGVNLADAPGSEPGSKSDRRPPEVTERGCPEASRDLSRDILNWSSLPCPTQQEGQVEN